MRARYVQPAIPSNKCAAYANSGHIWGWFASKILAGVKADAAQVRFNGLDEPVVTDAPDFKKSLDIDHARDGEVMIAYAMNDEQLPPHSGFPLRLIVPG